MHLDNLSRADFLGLSRGGVVHGASVRRTALRPRSDGLLGRAVRHIHLFLRFCQCNVFAECWCLEQRSPGVWILLSCSQHPPHMIWGVTRHCCMYDNDGHQHHSHTNAIHTHTHTHTHTHRQPTNRLICVPLTFTLLSIAVYARIYTVVGAFGYYSHIGAERVHYLRLRDCSGL